MVSSLEERLIRLVADTSYGNVLQAACATGPESIVDFLLEKGADPTTKGKNPSCRSHMGWV
jgi:ankyrin repeat protein